MLSHLLVMRNSALTLNAYADGTKLSPVVHLPGLKPLLKNEILSGIIIYMYGARKKSWADETSIKFWLQKLFGVNNRRRCLLVLEPSAVILLSLSRPVGNNTDMVVIPGGCTSKLQAADVSWNRHFKARCSELYNEWLFSATVEKTRFGNRRAPPKPLLLRWVKESWVAITPESVG